MMILNFPPKIRRVRPSTYPLAPQSFNAFRCPIEKGGLPDNNSLLKMTQHNLTLLPGSGIIVSSKPGDLELRQEKGKRAVQSWHNEVRAIGCDGDNGLDDWSPTS